MSDNFETSLNRIGEIIKSLESNDLDLDASIKLYKEGIELTSQCYKKLNEVEKQSIKILEDNDLNKVKEEIENV